MYDGQIAVIVSILILIWLAFFWKSPEEKFKRKIKKLLKNKNLIFQKFLSF